MSIEESNNSAFSTGIYDKGENKKEAKKINIDDNNEQNINSNDQNKSEEMTNITINVSNNSINDNNNNNKINNNN